MVKRACLCGSWQKRRLVLNPPSCARELNLLGGSGGQHSWHVLLDVLLPASLLGLRGCGGVDGGTPQSHDVEQEWRHVSLSWWPLPLEAVCFAC